MGLFSNFKKVWNIFSGNSNKSYDQNQIDRISPADFTSLSYVRPDRIVVSQKSEKTYAATLYNRIANECASMIFRHVKVDEKGRPIEIVDSGLNECLNRSANLDETGKMLIRNIVMSLCDEGVVAVVPTDYDEDPENKVSDILSLRVAKIVGWLPSAVQVELYNEKDGQHYTLTLPKQKVAIIENPLYAIMNERNSTLQSLVRKLALLDIVDEEQGSGKIDLIVQLPYSVHSETRRKEAEQRRQSIESQLRGSKFGIAYTDATEKITQLNRPVENNVLKSVEYLTSMLLSQLGATMKVLDGTADEQTMLNFRETTIKPFADAIVDEFERKFLTKTARTQGHRIKYYSNPFSIIPVEKLAEIADKMTRNEIMSSNEVRQIVGLMPVDDPKADELRNKNLNESKEVTPPATTEKVLESEDSSSEKGKSKKRSVTDKDVKEKM